MSIAEVKARYGVRSDRPMIAVAPMAGVTDLPFRGICESLGADFSVTEMAASAPQLLASAKNQARLHFTPTARVKILQIIGNDVKQMTFAAEHYAAMGAEVIDINLGCPAKKISSKGAGSALLSDLPLIQRILQSITQHCPVPVTVKTRLGPTHDDYTLSTIAAMAVDYGVDLLTVHGRSRACKFNGEAQFDEIAAVKQRYPELCIIANGDIDNVEKAATVLKKTACDGVMIGRGAVGNPWLFADVKAVFKGSEPLGEVLNHVDTSELIQQHILAIHQFYGDDKGVRFARKHIQAYLKKLGLSDCFSTLATIADAETQRQQLASILKSATKT